MTNPKSVIGTYENVMVEKGSQHAWYITEGEVKENSKRNVVKIALSAFEFHKWKFCYKILEKDKYDINTQ